MRWHIGPFKFGNIPGTEPSATQRRLQDADAADKTVNALPESRTLPGPDPASRNARHKFRLFGKKSAGPVAGASDASYRALTEAVAAQDAQATPDEVISRIARFFPASSRQHPASQQETRPKDLLLFGEWHDSTIALIGKLGLVAAMHNRPDRGRPTLLLECPPETFDALMKEVDRFALILESQPGMHVLTPDMAAHYIQLIPVCAARHAGFDIRPFDTDGLKAHMAYNRKTGETDSDMDAREISMAASVSASLEQAGGDVLIVAGLNHLAALNRHLRHTTSTTGFCALASAALAEAATDSRMKDNLVTAISDSNIATLRGTQELEHIQNFNYVDFAARHGLRLAGQD